MPDKPAGHGPQEPKPDSKPDPLAQVMLQAGRVHRVEGQIYDVRVASAPPAASASPRPREVRVKTPRWLVLFISSFQYSFYPQFFGYSEASETVALSFLERYST
jgi:hypothetical protein